MAAFFVRLATKFIDSGLSQNLEQQHAKNWTTEKHRKKRISTDKSRRTFVRIDPLP